MSMVSESDRPLEDLTARARIRDAALGQFAEHGFTGATIRGIAEAAGVSPGLVQHHFGSKDELRRACDEAVLELVRRKITATRTGEITQPGFVAALYAAAAPVVRYLARVVVDGSGAGATLVDELVEGTEEYLSANWPERFPAGSQRSRDAAAVLVAQSAGTLVLHEHVARLMDLEPWADITSPRIGLAQLDVYEAVGGLVASGFGDRIREAVAARGSDGRGEGKG
ncbi:MAG TPA: TetR family transcriptional regulator [Actinomycetota bacterium]|nr:TetR family transcriptional regulator [Actinomycetota bacterium]